MMPLAYANSGDENKVVKVTGDTETRRFLENLGFVADTQVTVINRFGGNVIVDVKGSRVAINEEMATHILV